MNLLNTTPYWFVLFTMPHHEKMVHQNLSRKGIETFLPLTKATRQWSDRKKEINVPYFPNYVFVNIAPLDRFKVFDVPGIVRYLDSNRNPTVVRSEDIQLIKQAAEGNFEVTNEVFVEGDWVSVTSGPLKNLRGLLVNRKGNNRLLVAIESVSKTLMIDVSPYQLKRIGPQTEALTEAIG